MRRPARTVVAATAAFVLGVSVASAGTAVAAKLITGKEIRNGTITAKDLSKGLRGKLGQPGPTGPPGPAGPAAGPAGGALTGTYPNPGLAPGAVTPGAFGTIPAVVARRTSNQLIGAGITLLTFESEEFDTAGLFTPGTSTTRLRAPVAGLYWVQAQVEWESNPTGRRALRVNRNAETTALAVDSAAATSVGNTVHSVSRLLALAAGDYVTIDVSHTVAGGLNILSATASMHWVAPL